jgi:uncharacterized protein YciI
VELEAFELVMLRSAPDRAGHDYDEETLDRLQAEHLAFHAELRAKGQVVTNGPVMDQPDPTLRGVAFYRLGSLQAARDLAETDPAVVAGLLVVDVMTWWCAPGTMVAHGTPFTLGA